MTVCAGELTTGSTARATARHDGWVLATDGSYAARLTDAGHGAYVERWSLDGPEPYTVDLPAQGPESWRSALLALADGRVLITRPGDGVHRFALLYPTGPGTGELRLGAVESDRLTLLPPAPDGVCAYVLAPGFETTVIWQVAGPRGPSARTAPGRAGAVDAGGPVGGREDATYEGPVAVAEVPGHCVDGHWLDRGGQLLALNRRAADGRTKAVAVDLGRGGAVTPLLHLTERSDDQLLLADPDSGLLLVRSNAPGESRTGWGVMGSHQPIRFPAALRQADVTLTPFAIQPGQSLLPESATVALRADGPNGTWAALWRPGRRGLRHLAAPSGWLPGAGLLRADGELLLPYATAQTPCGLSRVPSVPDAAPDERASAGAPGPASAPTVRGMASAQPICRPVPLQQAPLT